MDTSRTSITSTFLKCARSRVHEKGLAGMQADNIGRALDDLPCTARRSAVATVPGRACDVPCLRESGILARAGDGTMDGVVRPPTDWFDQLTSVPARACGAGPACAPCQTEGHTDEFRDHHHARTARRAARNKRVIERRRGLKSCERTQNTSGPGPPPHTPYSVVPVGTKLTRTVLGPAVWTAMSAAGKFS